MSQPVIIENDCVRLSVWPTLGGKVSSVVDKADKFELMFDYPSELPTRPMYDEPFDSGWFAGWDECFPAVSAGRYPGHPYDGVSIPDHGELWGLPTTAVPTKAGITTVWHGLRFGYRLTRKLHLDGPTITSDYTLVNLAPFALRFVWSQHALMSMLSPVRLAGLPGGSAFRYSHDADGVDRQLRFAWPAIEPQLDASDVTALPPRLGWKLFSMDPIETPISVEYPARQRSVQVAYAAEEEGTLPAYWGIWINTGGWGGNRHFAIEPTTGRFDQLDRSVTDGSAGTVGPSGRCGWSTRWTLGAASANATP